MTKFAGTNHEQHIQITLNGETNHVQYIQITLNAETNHVQHIQSHQIKTQYISWCNEYKDDRRLK